jgi:hypothetical protein
MSSFVEWLGSFKKWELGAMIVAILVLIGCFALVFACIHADSVTCDTFFPNIPKMVCMFSQKYSVVPR